MTLRRRRESVESDMTPEEYYADELTGFLWALDVLEHGPERVEPELRGYDDWKCGDLEDWKL